MHEVSLVHNIVSLVSEYATRCNATHVRTVRLRVGEANHVTNESLIFCFEALTRDNSVLAGARLCIDTIPSYARCKQCETVFAIQDFNTCCPHCGAWGGTVVSGTEFEVREIEVEQDAEAQKEAEERIQ